MPDTRQTHPAEQLSHDDIARRAYELYCDGQGQDGHDVEHWLRAEEELRAAQLPRTVEKPDRRATRLRSANAAPSQAANRATDKTR